MLWRKQKGFLAPFGPAHIPQLPVWDRCGMYFDKTQLNIKDQTHYIQRQRQNVHRKKKKRLKMRRKMLFLPYPLDLQNSKKSRFQLLLLRCFGTNKTRGCHRDLSTKFYRGHNTQQSHFTSLQFSYSLPSVSYNVVAEDSTARTSQLCFSRTASHSSHSLLFFLHQ